MYNVFKLTLLNYNVPYFQRDPHSEKTDPKSATQFNVDPFRNSKYRDLVSVENQLASLIII